ncbi:hypothetical protein [Algibacter pacificus]|uniref:hypothetical protein n=1 Tax=Algibacter pacificus TaxID=2599389 RepID=UPI0011CA11DB|nr:hypothetical protein [Algibacter pacificus]
MADLKSKFELVLERLNEEGKVTVINEEDKDEIMDKVAEELDEYRFENQKKIRESQQEIATVVLTS